MLAPRDTLPLIHRCFSSAGTPLTPFAAATALD
jgi:hypothetical protein